MRSREYRRDGNVLTLIEGGVDLERSEATRVAHEALARLADTLPMADPIFQGVEAIRDALKLRLGRDA